MRASLMVLATLITAPVVAQDSITSFSEAMAKASAGSLAPLQMPDGAKLWRYVSRQLKGDDVDLRLTDLIAQALARAQWCENGWEETKRSTQAGMLVVEGRCK